MVLELVSFNLFLDYQLSVWPTEQQRFIIQEPVLALEIRCLASLEIFSGHFKDIMAFVFFGTKRLNAVRLLLFILQPSLHF